MELSQQIYHDPSSYLARHRPDAPVVFLSPAKVQAQAAGFIAGFPGLVTYAVKANPDPLVIGNLTAAGITAFDVASPREIALIRELVPGAALHYNNPVRSRAEVAAAVAAGVASYSVDAPCELTKLAEVLPKGTEVSVRFKLPVKGAVYDFGAKFGATPDTAIELLQKVAAAGLTPSLTFHPGTQCTDPAAWSSYILAAADIARNAGVRLARLNVGGGFPSHRAGDRPRLRPIFNAIRESTHMAFGGLPPKLVCEPGRALAAEGLSLAVQVRAVRNGREVFLNDGIYGGLAEAPLMGNINRLQVLRPDGQRRGGPSKSWPVFGPTCDSVDKLPDSLMLPETLAEGDYILIAGIGAYSTTTVTHFNGYGRHKICVVMEL
ncbi:ornithine decarboxylase [Actibacterium mucosum KCTC 23349]|uniref:ornithine decarboxylase n=1 Tax=Actibacterium mucosum KCTC 23349 TaxID=1454373 RepID=A0A037ZKB3_9RHOB|nr:type III PLP-dependent enzyme [Actibacterium mucosum]KAJ56543.1 ornithine decarboxylase [Actibacterium mucosum KCTC 23349]